MLVQSPGGPLSAWTTTGHPVPPTRPNLELGALFQPEFRDSGIGHTVTLTGFSAHQKAEARTCLVIPPLSWCKKSSEHPLQLF